AFAKFKSELENLQSLNELNPALDRLNSELKDSQGLDEWKFEFNVLKTALEGNESIRKVNLSNCDLSLKSCDELIKLIYSFENIGMLILNGIPLIDKASITNRLNQIKDRLAPFYVQIDKDCWLKFNDEVNQFRDIEVPKLTFTNLRSDIGSFSTLILETRLPNKVEGNPETLFPTKTFEKHGLLALDKNLSEGDHFTGDAFLDGVRKKRGEVDLKPDFNLQINLNKDIEKESADWRIFKKGRRLVFDMFKVMFDSGLTEAWVVQLREILVLSDSLNESELNEIFQRQLLDESMLSNYFLDTKLNGAVVSQPYRMQRLGALYDVRYLSNYALMNLFQFCLPPQTFAKIKTQAENIRTENSSFFSTSRKSFIGSVTNDLRPDTSGRKYVPVSSTQSWVSSTSNFLQQAVSVIGIGLKHSANLVTTSASSVIHKSGEVIYKYSTPQEAMQAALTAEQHDDILLMVWHLFFGLLESSSGGTKNDTKKDALHVRWLDSFIGNILKKIIQFSEIKSPEVNLKNFFKRHLDCYETDGKETQPLNIILELKDLELLRQKIIKDIMAKIQVDQASSNAETLMRFFQNIDINILIELMNALYSKKNPGEWFEREVEFFSKEKSHDFGILKELPIQELAMWWCFLKGDSQHDALIKMLNVVVMNRKLKEYSNLILKCFQQPSVSLTLNDLLDLYKSPQKVIQKSIDTRLQKCMDSETDLFSKVPLFSDLKDQALNKALIAPLIQKTLVNADLEYKLTFISALESIGLSKGDNAENINLKSLIFELCKTKFSLGTQALAEETFFILDWPLALYAYVNEDRLIDVLIMVQLNQRRQQHEDHLRIFLSSKLRIMDNLLDGQQFLIDEDLSKLELLLLLFYDLENNSLVSEIIEMIQKKFELTDQEIEVFKLIYFKGNSDCQTKLLNCLANSQNGKITFKNLIIEDLIKSVGVSAEKNEEYVEYCRTQSLDRLVEVKLGKRNFKDLIIKDLIESVGVSAEKNEKYVEDCRTQSLDDLIDAYKLSKFKEAIYQCLNIKFQCEQGHLDKLLSCMKLPLILELDKLLKKNIQSFEAKFKQFIVESIIEEYGWMDKASYEYKKQFIYMIVYPIRDLCHIRGQIESEKTQVGISNG
ncbi:MAG: hypothetical protein VW397_05865, partial [Candidatus Margulisiibacteriota bacterium]